MPLARPSPPRPRRAPAALLRRLPLLLGPDLPPPRAGVSDSAALELWTQDAAFAVAHPAVTETTPSQAMVYL